MTPIFSSSALQAQQREIKNIAKEQIVHITENGNAAFVFCSEELFDRVIQEAREEAAAEARMAAIIERGRTDAANNRTWNGTASAFEEIERRVAHNG